MGSALKTMMTEGCESEGPHRLQPSDVHLRLGPHTKRSGNGAFLGG